MSMVRRVHEGAMLLDRKSPGILDRLSGEPNIEFNNTCMLAKLYGSYLDGHRALFGAFDPKHQRSADCGFFALARVAGLASDHPEVRKEYAELTKAWQTFLHYYREERAPLAA